MALVSERLHLPSAGPRIIVLETKADHGGRIEAIRANVSRLHAAVRLRRSRGQVSMRAVPTSERRIHCVFGMDQWVTLRVRATADRRSGVSFHDGCSATRPADRTC